MSYFSTEGPVGYFETDSGHKGYRYNPDGYIYQLESQHTFPGMITKARADAFEVFKYPAVFAGVHIGAAAGPVGMIVGGVGAYYGLKVGAKVLNAVAEHQTQIVAGKEFSPFIYDYSQFRPSNFSAS